MELDLFGQAFSDPMQQRRRAGMGSHQATSSITDEWITPRSIIDALGLFDLDPCSPGDRRPWDTACRHLSIEDDGLAAPWAGRVWLNPPYSEAGAWLGRLAAHGRGTALIFARTETATWFEHVWPRASALLFVRGRLTFHHVDGSLSGYNAGAPSVLVAYGERDAELLHRAPIFGHYIDLRRTR
jgi:hypothetical protein